MNVRMKIHKCPHKLITKNNCQSGFPQNTMAIWKKVNKDTNFNLAIRYF